MQEGGDAPPGALPQPKWVQAHNITRNPADFGTGMLPGRPAVLPASLFFFFCPYWCTTCCVSAANRTSKLRTAMCMFHWPACSGRLRRAAICSEGNLMSCHMWTLPVRHLSAGHVHPRWRGA